MPAARSRSSTPLFPARAVEVDFLLAEILAYLQAPTAAAKIMAALREATTQEEQIHYALVLRGLKAGWTPALREEYFRWFVTTAAAYRGGNTFANALRTIKSQAIETLSADERTALKPILDARPAQRSPRDLLAARKPVKEWTRRRAGAGRRARARASGAIWSEAASSTAPWPAPPATASAAKAAASGRT